MKSSLNMLTNSGCIENLQIQLAKKKISNTKYIYIYILLVCF